LIKLDHPNGSSWPVQKLIPCKLAALPHHSGQHLPHHSGHNHLVFQQQIAVFHVKASIISSP